MPEFCLPGTYRKTVWKHDPAADAPPRYRRACQYAVFIPERLKNLKVNLDAETAGAVSHAEAEIAALNGRAHPALAPLARLLLRTESIASSKVEGLQIEIRELARAEARALAGDKVGPTAREIIANIDTMQLAIGQAANAGKTAVGDIVTIHKRLMEQSPTPTLAGKIRTVQNWLGGNNYNPCRADFVPPPHEEVSALLADLCHAIDDDTLPPVAQAAVVHAQFETIHPFMDGNGRAGRALIHVVLRRRHLAPDYVPPVSVVLANDKDRYIAGLTAFRGDDVSDWIGHFADSMGTAATLARRYVDAVQQQVERWRDALKTFGAPRADAAAWALIDALPAHPMITGPAAVSALGRSKPNVYQALDQLERAGVLKTISDSKRGKVWEADGLINLLEGLEAGRMPVGR